MLQEVFKSAEVQPGTAKKVVLDGIPIAVARDSDGTIHAIGDTCTHGNISLSEGFVEDDTIECWAHGATFSLKTGAALTLPAYEPVKVYEVTEENGAIFVNPEVTIDQLSEN